MMAREIWKDIKGYNGLYRISNLGRVFSVQYGFLKPILKKQTKYYVVGLPGEEGKRQKQYLIHRLVAEAFIPNPSNLPVVDHINTITTDNRVVNLRWCSIRDNVNNKISMQKRLASVRKNLCGRIGVEANRHREVAQYSRKGELIKIWGCMSDAWRFLGIDSGSLTKACQGKQPTAGGFIWRYIE